MHQIADRQNVAAARLGARPTGGSSGLVATGSREVVCSSAISNLFLGILAYLLKGFKSNYALVQSLCTLFT